MRRKVAFLVLAALLPLPACGGPVQPGPSPRPTSTSALRFVRVLEQIEQQQRPDAACQDHTQPRVITKVTRAEYWSDGRSLWYGDGWPDTSSPVAVEAPGDTKPVTIAERLLVMDLLEPARDVLWQRLARWPGADFDVQTPDPTGRPARRVSIPFVTDSGTLRLTAFYEPKAHELSAYEVSSLSACGETRRRIAVRVGTVDRVGATPALPRVGDVPERREFVLRRALKVNGRTLRTGTRIRVQLITCGARRQVAITTDGSDLYSLDLVALDQAVRSLSVVLPACSFPGS